MALIQNPQAVKFCNDKGRVMADVLVQTYQTSVAFLAEWNANANLAVALPNTADVVDDTADRDGRQLMTGTKINSLVAAAQAMVTWFETGSPSRITLLRQIAVNGQPRF